MTVNITGGTLTSRNNAAIAVYRLERVNGQWTTNENTKIVSYLAALTVSGGNFSAGSKRTLLRLIPRLPTKSVLPAATSPLIPAITYRKMRNPSSLWSLPTRRATPTW